MYKLGQVPHRLRQKRYAGSYDICVMKRDNKTSKGMAHTSYNRVLDTDKSSKNEVERTLVVYGTCDTLAGGLAWFFKEFVPCECCGGKSKQVRLNDKGRQYFNRRKQRN